MADFDFLDTLGEDDLYPSSALPRTLAALARQTPALTTPTSGVDKQPQRTRSSYAVTTGGVPPGSAEATLAQINEKIGKRPEAGPLIDYARQRREQSNRDLMLALTLGAKGGEAFQPAAGHVLTQALKSGGDYEIPGGWGTVTDKGVVWNPEKQEQADLQRLTTIYAAQVRAENARAIADFKAGQGPRPRGLQHIGATPAGETVSFNQDDGQNYVVRGGKVQPYTGPVLSQATLDKQAEGAQKALAGVGRMEYLMQRVKQNPRAFGGLTSLAQYTGNWAGSRITAAQLSPQEQQVRGEVLREAAQVVNELYGAALSLGEQSRATGFVPDAGDTPDIVMNKLHAAVNWARMKSQEHGQGILNAAQARNQYGAPPPAAQAPAGRGTADSPITVRPKRRSTDQAPQGAVEVPY